jgi:hypothetical protein
MRATDILRPTLPGVLAVLVTTCASNQKTFYQMTAQEHLEAAARENDLADKAFEKIHGEHIQPPETTPTGDVYNFLYQEWGGNIPYTYEPGEPSSSIAWPRISDPSERYEDAASKHRANALRHERAAAGLEGRPSPQPLPPPESSAPAQQGT